MKEQAAVEELDAAIRTLKRHERARRRGRPIFGERRMTRSFCVKVPSVLAGELLQLAAAEGVSPSEVFRRLLLAHLDGVRKK